MAEAKRGVFLVLEGVEGSGKSTQARLLVEALSERGVPHLLVREPGHTPEGEEIRRVLLESEDIPARAELLLMLAARAILVERVVRPALSEGRVVIADRFDLSTLAYQGHGRGLPLDQVRQMNAFATAGVAPDLVLVLDVSMAEGEARRAAAGKRPDRIEQAGESFHERVARAYAALAASDPGVERVDGTGPATEVHHRIIDRIQARIPETFGSSGG